MITRFKFIRVKHPAKIYNTEVNFILQEITGFSKTALSSVNFYMHNFCNTYSSHGSQRKAIFYVISIQTQRK